MNPGSLTGLLATPGALAAVVFRTVAVYTFIVVAFRLAPKREYAQLTPFDLTLILLLANSVQNAMVGPDTSLVGGLVAAAVLIVLNTTVGRLAARNHAFSRLLRGHARILVNRGVIQEHNLQAEQISREELLQVMREHGVATTEDVRLAVLEVDGTISVLKNEDVPEAGRKPHRRFRFRKTQS